jgi:hypothetical protein
MGSPVSRAVELSVVLKYYKSGSSCAEFSQTHDAADFRSAIHQFQTISSLHLHLRGSKWQGIKNCCMGVGTRPSELTKIKIKKRKREKRQQLQKRVRL